MTRDSYIGLGAGAGSCVPGAFYFNTFSVDEYVRTCVDDRLPVALKLDLTDLVARYYWLYWRLYDTCVDKAQLLQVFGDRDRRLRPLMWVARALGLYREDAEQLCLTEPGAFWLHLIQNYFALAYVDRVWSAAMAEPWPEEIRI